MSIHEKTLFLPDDVLEEIACQLADRSIVDAIPSPSEISKPYKDLASFRLVSRRCNDAASHHLFRYVFLKPRRGCSYSFGSSSSSSKALSSIEKFVDVARAQPELARRIEVLRARIECSYERQRKFRDVGAEYGLLPSLESMKRLRLVSFEPYVSGPSFVEFLHPEARIESVGSLCIEDGPLRLDGPSFQTLKRLTLNLDGDERGRNAKVPSTRLYLPSSLLHLKLYSIDQRGFSLSLDQPVPALKAFEIVERGMDAASLRSFFKTQGPFLTSLILLGEDLGIAAFEYYEDETHEWLDPDVREEYHDDLLLLLPLISLCPNLVSIEIYDIHFPLLAQRGHPSIEFVILQQESTFANLLAQAEDPQDPDLQDDAFENLSIAIYSHVNLRRLPKLKTIRYGSEKSTWKKIFEGQSFDQSERLGLEIMLGQLKIELVDGVGVKWVDICLDGEERSGEVDGDGDAGEASVGSEE